MYRHLFAVNGRWDYLWSTLASTDLKLCQHCSLHLWSVAFKPALLVLQVLLKSCYGCVFGYFTGSVSANLFCKAVQNGGHKCKTVFEIEVWYIPQLLAAGLLTSSANLQKQCKELAGWSEGTCDWVVDWKIVFESCHRGLQFGSEILEEPVEILCPKIEKMSSQTKDVSAFGWNLFLMY